MKKQSQDEQDQAKKEKDKFMNKSLKTAHIGVQIKNIKGCSRNMKKQDRKYDEDRRVYQDWHDTQEKETSKYCRNQYPDNINSVIS